MAAPRPKQILKKQKNVTVTCYRYTQMLPLHMDAPKCRVCGKKEFGHVCGGSPPLPDKSDEAITDYYTDLRGTAKKIEATPSTDDGILTVGICPTCRTDLDKVAARLEYQRELMRKRRAKNDS